MKIRINYKQLYLHLFNAITDALGQMAQQNYGAAAKLLRRAQIAAEESVLANGEKDTAAAE